MGEAPRKPGQCFPSLFYPELPSDLPEKEPQPLFGCLAAAMGAEEPPRASVPGSVKHGGAG